MRIQPALIGQHLGAYAKKTWVGLTTLLFTTPVFASTTGGGLPWDTTLQSITNELTGSVAHWIVIIAIAVSGLGFAFGESGGAFRKGAGIVFGGSLAAGAVTVAATFGIAGAVI